ncbi:MAG: Stealth CR1 domain-containing protein [Fibromonadaceae bacterium]|jgi:hypothetical protein|nr:Stealth CR1 domain-containing protein [Fibromonadaceae bacterium]
MGGHNPIDIVIAWVDGSDPEWLAEKKKYSPEANTDDRVARYRDWDNLQYIFRGIEKFAPWINNVFLVIYGHLPKWLNKEHPKLRIVNHKDYIPAEYLPAFSANPIELNFHRIAELSEHFVYFNDDMFLLKKTSRDDFFKDGKPCDCAVLTAHSHTEDRYYMFMEYRATGILNKYFKVKDVIRSNRKGWFNLKYGKMLFRSWVLSGFPRFTGIWHHHLPTSLCKSTMVELWEKEGEKLRQTCLNKFRTMTDFNQWVFRNWQLASNNFYPRSVRFGKRFETDDSDYLSRIADYIENQRGHVVCINDSDSNMSYDEFVNARNIINGSFGKILPEKSGFEI